MSGGICFTSFHLLVYDLNDFLPDAEVAVTSLRYFVCCVCRMPFSYEYTNVWHSNEQRTLERIHSPVACTVARMHTCRRQTFWTAVYSKLILSCETRTQHPSWTFTEVKCLCITLVCSNCAIKLCSWTSIFSQGSAATAQLIVLSPASFTDLSGLNSENITKVGQYLPKSP